MIKFKISRLLFISYLISASRISAFDAPDAVEKISHNPTGIVLLAINTDPESLSGTIISKKESKKGPFSQEERINLLVHFLDGRMENIVDFFMDRTLMDYHTYLDIVKSTSVQATQTNPLSKEAKLTELAEAFAQKEISSDPPLQEMYYVKAAMTYSAASQHTIAEEILGKIHNGKKNKEILFAQTIVYSASGNFEKCINYGKPLEESRSFCDEKIFPALPAFLRACYFSEKEELAHRTVREQLLPLVIKDYSLQELTNLYHYYADLVPANPIEELILDDLRGVTVAHFTSKLARSYKEARSLLRENKVKEAKIKLEECCRNPFATLNMLSDRYILDLKLGLNQPKLSILCDLADKIFNKNDFDSNFSEVIRTLREEADAVKTLNFSQELGNLSSKLQKIFLHEKMVINEDQTSFKDYFQACLWLIAEQTDTASQTLEEDNQTVEAEPQPAPKKKGRSKRKKKNRNKPPLTQQIQEEQTPSSRMAPNPEEVQSLNPSNSSEKIAITQVDTKDKDEKKLDILLPLIPTSTLAQPLPAEEEPSGLENIELSVDELKVVSSPEAENLDTEFQHSRSDHEQSKQETEADIIAHLGESSKEELIGFIREFHRKALKIQARADQLKLENDILKEENERFKTRGN